MSTDKGFTPTREEVVQFLDSVILCTISTVTPSGQPMAAVVGFSSNSKFEFVINTGEATRKARNIESNSKVALTVTDADLRYTVQLEGTARQITPEEYEPYTPHHYEKLPWAIKYRDKPEEVTFLISPTELRFSDCTVYPYLVTKITL